MSHAGAQLRLSGADQHDGMVVLRDSVKSGNQRGEFVFFDVLQLIDEQTSAVAASLAPARGDSARGDSARGE